nr:hypothetical protein [uncultured Holophaga sp.]
MIKISIDSKAIEVKLKNVPKQVAWAAMKAINQVALKIQEDQRAEMNKEFTIRKAAFMRNRIKMFRFAKTNQDEIYAEVGIDSNVKGAKLLLARFEKGGKKTNEEGHGILPGTVPIPLTGAKARPEFRKSVPVAYRLQNLGLRSVLRRKGSGAAIIGNKHTFVLPTNRGEYVLMQRGPGGRTNGPDPDISPLYLFRNNVPIPKLLKFLSQAKALAGYMLPRVFKRWLQYASRTQK